MLSVHINHSTHKAQGEAGRDAGHVIRPAAWPWGRMADMLRAIVRLIAVAAAVWVTAEVLPGVQVNGDAFTYLGIALIFSLVNLVIGNLIKLLTMPLTRRCSSSPIAGAIR